MSKAVNSIPYCTKLTGQDNNGLKINAIIKLTQLFPIRFVL